VAKLVAQTKRDEEGRQRAEKLDRAKLSFQDGYTTRDQMVQVCDFFMNKKSEEGLRDKLSFLLSHFCMLRGESVREMELADMQMISLQNESKNRNCPALICLLRQGKTNQFHRLEVAATIRAENTFICSLSSLAMYFVWRWHLSGENFPSFADPDKWYDIKLLKGGNGITTPMSYNTHLERIDEAFKAAKIRSKAKTHAARGSAVRMAEIDGCPEESIRRCGRWNNKALEGCYMSQLPREAMRVLAGFNKDPGNYFLRRDCRDPPISLQCQIYPSIDEMLQRHEEEDGVEINLAAIGFLKLLKELRIIFIQDSVELRERYPDHPIWRLDLFDS